jgi:rSAM/selenodomain-associated transferase 2
MISVIIPTYNEEGNVAKTINKVYSADGQYPIEIIIADGGSTDQTVNNAGSVHGTKITKIVPSGKGRAVQMNKGASAARGKILYFLHADSFPPKNFTHLIANAVDRGFCSGCFRLNFDYSHWFLAANCWFTRFNVNAVRFGDQSLFVTRDIFEKSGGFREDLLMMEDQEIIHRIKKHGRFTVINKAVTTSARKYLDNGVYRMQAIFFRIWFLYYLGYSQEYLLKLHRKLIRNYKL